MESIVDWEVTMGVSLTEITNESVSVVLSDEPVYGRPSVLLRHSVTLSPGLF